MRGGRPGLDQMLKDASRRKFDVIMAWAIDRVGSSSVYRAVCWMLLCPR